VVQRVVAWDRERVVKGSSRATEEGAGRRSREDRGGNGKQLHGVVCLLFVVYQWRLYGVLERVVAYASRRLDVSPASRLVATGSVLLGRRSKRFRLCPWLPSDEVNCY
jgi:hypothetical protein